MYIENAMWFTFTVNLSLCCKDLGVIPNGLTNSPLSILCCRHVEDICLVSCVRFVVGLNVNGELFNKGTSVSKSKKKIKSKHTDCSNKEHASPAFIQTPGLKLNGSRSELLYLEWQHPLTAEDRRCVSHAHLFHLRCLQQSCHWLNRCVNRH